MIIHYIEKGSYEFVADIHHKKTPELELEFSQDNRPIKTEVYPLTPIPHEIRTTLDLDQGYLEIEIKTPGPINMERIKLLKRVFPP